MKTEIIESCYYEIVNEINDINKQREEINLKITEKQKEVDETFSLIGIISKEKNSLYDERNKLDTRLCTLNRMVEMLKSEVE